MNKHLHIICFTVPYPPDYGGTIDLFWKLHALKNSGVNIHLHCFNYGRGIQKELNKYCSTVHYYKRKTGIKGFSFSLPYIVASRKNEQLFFNLLKDDYPIILEGVHSSFILTDKRFENRKIIVRLHNVEFNYYNHLSLITTSLFKKIYYTFESRLLQKFESKIAKKDATFLTVTVKDKLTYKEELGCKNVDFLPLFIPDNWNLKLNEDIGNYCLYQADLSVSTNELAAIWLINNVMTDITIPFIIAGKNPSNTLQQLIKKYSHITLVANPDNLLMQRLIKDAQINILPSNSNTGIKLKLINALFNGKFCLVNNATIDGTELNQLCEIANTKEDMQQKIKTLFNLPFTQAEITKRENILLSIFNNKKNAEALNKIIFNNF